MSKFANRVLVQTGTTGTSTTVSLSTAALSNAYLNATQAGLSGGETYTWLIEDVFTGETPRDFSIVQGVYDSTNVSFKRTNVLASKVNGSVSTSNIDLSTEAQVSVVVAAEDLENISAFFAVTVGSSDWTQANSTSPWIAAMTVTGILDTDSPIVDIDLSGVAYADVPDVQNDWALVYRVEASDDDEVTLYATAEPVEDLDVQIVVVR